MIFSIFTRRDVPATITRRQSTDNEWSEEDTILGSIVGIASTNNGTLAADVANDQASGAFSFHFSSYTWSSTTGHALADVGIGDILTVDGTTYTITDVDIDGTLPSKTYNCRIYARRSRL